MRKKLPILVFLLFCCTTLLKAQSIYRSLGTGVIADLGQATYWETFDGTNWNPAAAAPTGATALPNGSTITIQAGDTWQNNIAATTIPTGVTLTINSNAALGTFSTTNKITSSGTIVFAGTAAQFLPSGGAFTTLTNLTINNSTTVSTTGSTAVTVLGVINLMAGQFNGNSGSNSLYVKGSIVANGGLMNASGNIFMQGAAAQTIVGTDFFNGQINQLNTSATSLSTTGALKVSNALRLVTGTFTLGGPLTISGATLSTTTNGIINTQDNMVLLSGTVAQNVPASFFTGNNVNNLTIGNSTTGATSAGPLNIGTAYTVTPLKAGVVPLTVTGTATIGGTFTVGSFSVTPTVGQQFTILSATAVSGTFTGGVTLPSGYVGTLAYSATNVKLTVNPSSNANLASLVLGSGTLTPVFDVATNNYTVSVPNATSTITITPTLADASATIKVNGTTLASGATSAALPLTVGSNTITTVVTAFDGTTKQTYTVTVTRLPLSTDATLSALALSSGTLSPVFTTGNFNYTASVPNAVGSITITPTLNDATATLTVNGNAQASGAASAAIPLNVGSNTITTVITAQDGLTTQSYTVAVTRIPLSTDATLSNFAISNGTLSPAFASATTAYTASVNNATTSITITPTVNDVNATVTVNGTAQASGAVSAAMPLIVGSNTITTAVTAQNGTVQNYVLTVTRAASSNADLSAFSISNGTLAPVFAAATTTYTTVVASNVTSITVTPTTADATATVTVNGTAVTSGSASDSIPLNIGANTVITIVKAQDGTLKTYNLTVTKTALSSNAALAGLTLSSGTLSPVFATGTTSYTASVVNAVTSITLTPTLSDVNATIKVNGTTVANGTASTAQALIAGNNSINVAVTAQDGITINTYTIVVNRPGAAQTITFNPLTAVSYGTADVNPGATSSNATIPLTYTSSNTAVATITTGGAIHVIAAGSTVITASQSGNATYSAATPVQQTLTINKAVLTVNAVNATKVYGAALPSLSAAYTGFVNNETQAVLTTLATASTSATVASPVNSYAITASGAAAANYSFNYVAGALTVTPAPLTITANVATKIYGAALPALTAGYTGLVNGDTFASLTTQPTLVTPATIASPVGSYPVTAGAAVAANYTITYAAGSISVTPAPLTIMPNNVSVSYGAAIPALTTGYTGFVNNDDATKLTAQPVLNTTYTSASAVAAYPITASGAASPNYTITYANGTLTVNKAVLTVTANNATKVYGAANPALAVTYSGFVNSDAQSVLTAQAVAATTATTTSAAGNYPITASGAAAANYSFNYVAGTLSITASTRTFAFGAIPAHIYGDVDFSAGATVNTGETITYTTSDPNIATIVNGLVHIVNAGTFTITASIASSPNYADVLPLSQFYTISKAVQTISFNSLPVMQAGGPVLSLNLTSSVGLPVTFTSSNPSIAVVNGQNINALGVGSTIITATQAGNINYLPATYSQLLKVQDAAELVKVRPGLSPNGDGINDFLVIDGIQDYPDNKLTIVNRNGVKLFQTSGYNNLTNVFDGHASTNGGSLMQAGTYFYELEIKVNGETKRKAGYIVLKFN
jgi:gliding motility-associated-like protein